MTGKYKTLQALSGSFCVPALTALDDAHFELLWVNFRQMCSRVERILAAVNLTASAFLDEHFAEIQSELQPQWADGADALLETVLQQAGLGADELLAVRSSGAAEDSAWKSYAGLFDTKLNVRGLPAIRMAVQAVWASQFNRAVLIATLRTGGARRAVGMQVILQRMVSAEWAGVAFSHDPVSGDADCVVEVVAGVGESLVSGEVRGERVRFRQGVAVGMSPGGAGTRVAQQAAGLARQVSEHLSGRAVDLEWAHDGYRLWLLQVRPITTLGSDEAAAEPAFGMLPLYKEGDKHLEYYKPLPDFAQYFRTKRKPLADFASAVGVAQTASMLVRANKAGLTVPANAAALSTVFEFDQVVLDLSARVRQLIVPRNLLLPRLTELLDDRAVTFVVRDFVRGQIGLITQALTCDAGGSEAVLCEWSADGLLAINRGTAATAAFVIDGEGHMRPRDSAGAGLSSLTALQLDTLQRVTVAATQWFGRLQLEWVVAEGRLFLIDYSLLDSLVVRPGSDSHRVISVGFAQGTPLVIDATRSLERLSIAAGVSLTDVPTPQDMGLEVEALYQRMQQFQGPVVIVSPRPYAALAPLVRYAAGFVFEQASTLCHLAIILREEGVPAVESAELYSKALLPHTERVTVDCSSS